MKKIRFVVVGSGWRSQLYVRIAKALPQIFELCAMLCRTQEKADKMAMEHNIYTTTSIKECQDMRPDFVVVVVNKASIADVTKEWMQYGFTVFCETPASLELSVLQELWTLHKSGQKLVVAEQYTRYPLYKAMLSVVDQEIIGKPDCINISLAHEYHGASLMRAFLQEMPWAKFSVSAKCYEFETVETFTRYEHYTDGRRAMKKRVVATFEFEDGKVAWYDFDSEQYRSPIRKNHIKVQGCKGEIMDNHVFYLDENYESQQMTLESMMPQPAFTAIGFTNDEISVSELLIEAAEYARMDNNSQNTDENKRVIKEKMELQLQNSLQDCYMAILMDKSIQTGETITSEVQNWHKE